MPNKHGHPETLRSFTRVADEPLGKVIGVRLPQSWYTDLDAAAEGNVQQFIRDAIRSAIDAAKEE